MIMVITVAILFSFQLIFESLNILARISGSLISSNALGASLDKMLSTIKRFFIFAYAPILGYLVYLGDVSKVFFSIFIAIALGSLSILFIIIFRKVIIRYFIGVVLKMNKGFSIVESFTSPEQVNMYEYEGLSVRRSPWQVAAKIDLRMYIALILIYFIYASAVFIVNVLALAYTSAAPIILQMLGLINGLATIVMAFIIEPSLARVLEKGKGLNSVSESFLLAQFFSVALLSPMFFVIMYFYLF